MSMIEFDSSKDDKIRSDSVNSEIYQKNVFCDQVIKVPIWILEEVQDALRQTQNYRDEVRTGRETSLDRTIERTKNLVDNLLKNHCDE